MIKRMMRQWLLLGGALLLMLQVGVALVWHNFKSSSEFNGSYQSTGTVVQSDGQAINVSHSMLIKDGRFYAMTRQGQTILKTSGHIESGFQNRLRLRVEKSELAELQQAGELDNALLFDLLYSGETGSIINLRPSGACLLAVETHQFYCRVADL